MEKKHSEALKLIAAVSMVIDHIGFAFFPKLILLRIIGRLAFPIYAYQIALGWKKTSSKKKYIGRLTAVMVLAQLPYMLMLGKLRFNVIATFIAALGIIEFGKTRRYIWLMPALLVPFGVDYGIYGVATVLMFYCEDKLGDYAVPGFILLNLGYCSLTGYGVQYFSILALPLIKSRLAINGLSISKGAFYAVYPVHMALIVIIRTWLQ
ncbi:MAG: TraX family protein [bacterium]|jgi:hypothetical protein